MAQGDNIIIDVLGNTRPLEKQIEKVANNALILNSKGFSQPLGKINGQLGEFEKSLAASNARVIAFGASAGAIFAVQKAFSETIKSVISVEKSLIDINVILNASSKNLASFGNSLFDIAKNTGQTFSEVASAATEFSRQGLGIEDTLKRTSDALVLTRLTGMGVVDSVESITAALNSFNKTTITSNELINKLAAVDAGFAVSSADLAEAVRRVGSSAQDAGVSLDQLIALVTSAQQTTARGGAVIGNSFKTIFTRLQRTDTLDALEAIGVATKDQEGNILPLITILNSLSSTYSKLSGVQRAQVAELVGGVFQINVLKAALADLGNQYSIYSRALEVSNGASNEANSRNEELNQTLNATINKTLANLQKLASEAGNIAITPTLKNLLGGLNTALESFQPESEDIGSRIGQGLLKGIGSFLGGPGVLLAAAALFKIFERLVTFSADAFKSLTGLNAKTAEQQTLQAQILNLIGRNPQIIEQINSGNVNTANLHKQILSLIQQETVAMQRQLALAGTLSKSLISSGVRVAQSGPMRGVPTKSAGFIPNFNADKEVAGALAGGYMPGKIKQTFIPNYGMVTYNSAEKVKKFSGFNQPAIMPPQGSKAGKNYKENFEKSHGFNPYSFGGYVPNFVSKVRQQYDFRKILQKGYVQLGGAEYERAALEQNKSLFTDGTLIRSRDEIFVKEDKKNIITSQLRVAEKDAAVKRGGKEGGKIRSKSVFIYPDLEGGKKFESGGKAKDGTFYKFPVFPFPGGNKQIPDLLYDNVSKSLVDVAKNYISEITTRPNVVKSDLFESYVKSNLSRSVIEASTGQVFESALKSSINRINTSEIDNMDLDRTEIKAIASRFKGAKGLASFQDGDFKNSLSKGNLDSFANKLLFKDKKGQTSKFNGFIPNFAALKEAIGREVSAGVPASSIRVGASSSLTSNNNPLGLGVYNTRDEPRGLNQGINRYASKSEAKKAGAYNGHVPNFALAAAAPPAAFALEETNALKEKMKGLSTSISKVKVYFDDNALPQSIQKYKGNLIQASIGLSLASGLLQEATKNSPKLSQAIEGFSSTLSLAGTAAQIIPGKFGVAGAALLAVTGTFGTIANLLKEKSTKLADKAEQSSQTLTDFSNNSQKYADILQKLQDAQKDSKTSSQTIGKLNEDLVKAAGQIPDAYRKQLISITNYTDLLDQMSKIQSDLVNEESYYKGAARFEEILNKRTGTNLAQFAEAFSFRPYLSPRESIGYGLTGSEMDRTTSNISSKGFENNQARENLKRMLASGELDIFKTARSATFNPKKLEELGLRKDAIESITRLAEQGGNNSITPGQAVKAGFNTVGAIRDASKGDFNPFSGKGTGSISAQTLVQNILTKLLEEVVGGEEAKKLVEERNKERELIDKENALKQRSIDMEKARQDALDNFYQRLIQIGDVQQEYKDKLVFNAQDIQLERASGLLEYNRSSMGPQTSREYENLIKTAKQQLDFAKKYRDEETKARSDVLQEGYKTFLDLKKRNVPGETPKVDTQKLNEFQAILGQLATSGKSAGQIGQEIANSFNQFFGGTAFGSKGIDLQTQTNNILGDNQRALLDLNAQQIKQTELTKINNQIQAASIQRQRDVKSFGGLESYINPQSNSTIDSLITNIQGLGTPVGGRASAGTLLDTVKMFGGSLEGVNLGSLKERAIAGRARDIEFQTSAISKLLSRKGEFGLAGEYDKIGARSGEIARTQVEEAIQSQRAILDINKNVSTISTSLTNFTKAFTNPNQSTGLPNQPGANLQNTSQAVGNLTAGMSQIQIKNTDLSLKGNVAVDINQPNGPIQFTVDTDSIDNIKQDITTQIGDSLTTLRTDLENQIKDLTNSFNERIVSVGGQRLPPTKK
jgi:TP901 family phage tail tape measure protein